MSSVFAWPGKKNGSEKPTKKPKSEKSMLQKDDPEKALDAVCAKLDKNQKSNIEVCLDVDPLPSGMWHLVSAL